MLTDDSYKTIVISGMGVFRDKGSKFIAHAYHIRSDEEVKPLIIKLRVEHTKARHFCYAYRLTTDRTIFRTNDDGEPAGTAGRPILNCLLSEDLTYILIVVVRYFGGTLLGVPGLINAYKGATIEAIKNCVITEQSISDIYMLRFEYLQINDVMKVVKEDNLEVLNQEFDVHCTLKIAIKKIQLERVLNHLKKIDRLKMEYLNTY